MRLFRCGPTVFALGALSITACGGNDDDDDAGTPQSCLNVCDKENTSGCLAGTLQECQQDCADRASVPASCQSAATAFDNCELAQPDICSMDVLTACATELAASTSACGGS